jgi:hypothetical protein
MARWLDKILQRVLPRVLPAGIQARLYLLIALALLPVLLLLGWIYYQRYDSQRAHELQTQVEVAQGVATTFTAYLEGVRQQSHAVGQAILSSTPTRGQGCPPANNGCGRIPNDPQLELGKSVRTVLASSMPSLAGRDLSFRFLSTNP